MAEENTIIIPENPTMPQECVNYLTEQLKEVNIYLEYGSGGSTILASRLAVKNIISVESCQVWLQEVEKKIKLISSTSQRFDPLWIDVGDTKEWGYPVNNSGFKNYWKYSVSPWLFLKDKGLSPELVLIDGRFRVACFLSALVYSHPKTKILFDDYIDRHNYHMVEEFIKPITFKGRMAVFETNKRKLTLQDILPVIASSLTEVV